MNLTEGQLFTIEALNRIEDFAWPDGTSYASVDGAGVIHFFTSNPANGYGRYISSVHGLKGKKECKLESVTREQFDSVDGWVRVDKDSLPVINAEAAIDIKHFPDGDGFQSGSLAKFIKWGDVKLWRYHKPTKETKMKDTEMKDTEAFQPPIHETYYRYKKQRETTADARKALEASMEAEDKLIEQIKACNLEYGFDIRVLDESDEVPEVESELVITDWRDLRIGDVVWWSGAGCIDSGEYVVSNVESSDYKGSPAFCVSCAHGLEWVSTKFDKWKFIRRPSK